MVVCSDKMLLIDVEYLKVSNFWVSIASKDRKIITFFSVKFAEICMPQAVAVLKKWKCWYVAFLAWHVKTRMSYLLI